MLMEADLSICRCGKEMNIIEGEMVCPCGYRYNLPQRLPDYADLLLENKALREANQRLKDKLGNIP